MNEKLVLDELRTISKKLHSLFKDDLPRLWESTIGKSEG